ncbi:MAG: OmpA family protein [Bacteroidia bacterium]|nr:OmpA family protein [Bacteroidia bacterium]
MNSIEKYSLLSFRNLAGKKIGLVISFLSVFIVVRAQVPLQQPQSDASKHVYENRLNRFSLGLRISHLYDVKFNAYDLLSTGASANDLHGLNGSKTQFDMGAGIDVNYFFSPIFSMDFGYEQGKMTGANRTEYYESSVNFYSLGFNVSLKRGLRTKDYKFVPFARANVSRASYDSERKLISDDFSLGPKTTGSALMYGFGLGARYYFNKNWSIYLMSEYNTIATDAWDGYDYGSGKEQLIRSSVGIKYAFGRNKHVDQTLAWQDNRVDHLQARLDEQVSQAVKSINDSVNQTLASYLNQPGSKDSDDDGIVDKFDKCPDVAGLFSNNGCPPAEIVQKMDEKQSAVDALLNKVNQDINPSLAEPKKGAGNDDNLASTFGSSRLNDEEKYRLKNELLVEMFPVRFSHNSYQINADAYQHLNTIAVILRNNDSYKLKITGYTDGVGSAEYNKKLGQQRANAVSEYLQSRGISTSRIKIMAAGKDQPLDDNSSKIGKANNRRVEFKLE